MSDPLGHAGLVIVDKPAGITSHDVVARLRRAFGTRRVGHAGTLDPAATGVLVIGVERGTRFLAHLVSDTKAYLATIRLGATTGTDDAEGEVVFRADAATLAGITDAGIDAAIAALTGDLMQRPATVSAIKVDGRRAHERVRAGEEVELPPRPVTVTRFEVLARRRSVEGIDLDVLVECSSGTYVRALARDLGEALGVGGHLTALRRSASGPFTLADAHPLADIEAEPALSLTLDQALIRCFPIRPVTAEEVRNLSQGKWLEPIGMPGVYAAVAPGEVTVALLREQGSRAASVFVARPAGL